VRALDLEPEQMNYQVDEAKGYVLVLGMVFSQEEERDLQPSRGQGQILFFCSITNQLFCNN